MSPPTGKINCGNISTRHHGPVIADALVTARKLRRASGSRLWLWSATKLSESAGLEVKSGTRRREADGCPPRMFYQRLLRRRKG